MRTLALILFATLLVAGCGDSPATKDPSATTTTSTTPAAQPAAPSTTTAPGSTDAATAKAICAEPFYAEAFNTIAECEAKMSDPEAVAELRESIEQAGRETEEAKDRIQERDKDGDGQIDAGALPGVP